MYNGDIVTMNVNVVEHIQIKYLKNYDISNVKPYHISCNRIDA